MAAAEAGSLRALGITLASLALFAHAVPAQAGTALAGSRAGVRVLTIHYTAHDGRLRRALVILPRWYGPRRDPPLALVISPHGRGVKASSNVRMWQNYPAVGRFAVVNPEGEGRRFALYSWGDPGEIRDLARMPGIVREALPWVRIAPRRVYAIGGSMGGQEALLLVARDPFLLAGAAVFDAPTDLAARYRFFPRLVYGLELQRMLRTEVGGPPELESHAYEVRSPLYWAHAIAFSHVPLQIWWSTHDQIIRDQAAQSRLLFRRISRIQRTRTRRAVRRSLAPLHGDGSRAAGGARAARPLAAVQTRRGARRRPNAHGLRRSLISPSPRAQHRVA